MSKSLSKIIRLVMILNLSYFLIEFTVALSIHSVSLFADSIDFLEDGFVNLLILLAMNWSLKKRSRVGMALAMILLLPGIATLWTAWSQFHFHYLQQPIPLTLTGIGALVVNFTCALMLARYRKHAGSLTHAAFLSARNDVLANIAIIIAGIIMFFFNSIWPDLVVGIGIAALNLDAAQQVWRAAWSEHLSDKIRESA